MVAAKSISLYQRRGVAAIARVSDGMTSGGGE